MTIVYLSRKEHFSAAHRLHSPALSDAENLATYGKCNHKHGHGHNYNVEVVVKGELNPRTGMVMNITELKECIRTAIMEPMDHKNLDIDVPYFADKPSTAENIAVYMWQELEKVLPRGELHEIVLRETDANVAIYRGE